MFAVPPVAKGEDVYVCLDVRSVRVSFTGQGRARMCVCVDVEKRSCLLSKPVLGSPNGG